MADKLTLLELHLHAEDNEFESDMQFSSDIAELLRSRLGFSSDEGDETDEFGIDDEDDSLTSIGTADGGDTMELDEEAEETDTESAVVEIDRDSDVVDEEEELEEDDSGGRSWGRTLLMVVLLVAVAYFARSYLGGEDIEDEFEEL